MSAAARLGRQFGNELYRVAFPIYRPLYAAFKAYTDRAERRLLVRQLSTGSVVVDAGANIGVYSRFLSQCVGPEGVVHSFEPSPENFTHLCALVSDRPSVHVNQLAVGDKTGESLLYLSDDLNVDHRAYPTAGETRKAVAIRTTALDDYFKPGARVDFIKMDIQGYELHALRGAKRVLEDNPKIELLLEFWPFGLQQAGGSAEALIIFLRNEGFATFLLGGNRLIECDHTVGDPRDPMSYSNLFAQRSGVAMSRT